MKRYIAIILAAAVCLSLMNAATANALNTNTNSDLPTIPLQPLDVDSIAGIAGYIMIHDLVPDNTYHITIRTADGDIVAEYITIPAAAQGTPQKMNVTISCTCSDYNHVGDEWYQFFSINNYRIKSGDTVNLTSGQSITILTEITEIDAKSDLGSASGSWRVTQENLADGFRVEQMVEVTEKDGRYSGCTAVWEVLYAFTP